MSPFELLYFPGKRTYSGILFSCYAEEALGVSETKFLNVQSALNILAPRLGFISVARVTSFVETVGPW